LTNVAFLITIYIVVNIMCVVCDYMDRLY